MICARIHSLAASLLEHTSGFDVELIPANGLYLVFEKGEHAHGSNRIVRVGTHTGQNQLLSRLKQHFLVGNKDRSIFRKNIGRALLARDGDSFLVDWELDLTSAAAKALYGPRVDRTKYEETENRVTEYMQANFTFVVLPVAEKADRLILESQIISAVALCKECGPSKNWLGNWSPKEKIRASGLWLVNELYKTPLDAGGLLLLQRLAKA
ncbi:MAG TPA: hypothetical protein VF696_00970 [Candidatus Paceibacterota bacterium]